MNMQSEKQENQIQKDLIMQKLKKRGGRITKQRKLIVDVILEDECSSCKEICYKVAKIDNTIGQATVYRTINMLEEIGVLTRKSTYQVQGLN